jgi:hypothetical protein
MSGSSNFLQFNPSLNNSLSDVDYNSDLTRVNGLSGGTARSVLHNKIFHQTTILSSALAQSFADLGYVVSDANFTNLKNVFATILNTSGGTMTGNLILNANPTLNLQAATKQYVDETSSSAANFTAGNGINIASKVISATTYVVAESLGVNGYRKWSDGFIEQWGLVGPFSSESGIIVTLPIPFTTEIYNVTTTIYLSEGASIYHDQVAQIYSPGLTTIGIYMQYFGGGGATWPVYAYWNAIGK